MCFRSPSLRSGFTLLEILVAIAIMAVIMMLVTTTTRQLLDGRERVERRDYIYQQGRVALRKLSDDLAVAFLVKKKAPIDVAAEQAGGSAISPAVSVANIPLLLTFFIGQDGGDRDALRFTTLSHLRLKRDVPESDQIKVQYELQPDAEDSRITNLVRIQENMLNDTTKVEGRTTVLARDVQQLSLEYYDVRKEEWVREWDTEKADWKDRLPLAVRMTIAFSDPEDEREQVVLTTAVTLALAAGALEP